MLRARVARFVAFAAAGAGLLAGCAAPGPAPSPHAVPANVATPATGGSEGADTVAAAVTAPALAPAAEPVSVPEVWLAADQGAEGVAAERDGRWIVGDGTPGSCTAAALTRATRAGGDVGFDCGPEQWTIVLDEPLTVCNTVGCAPEGEPLESLRIDGGGLVVLAGDRRTPLVYANACEPSLGSLPGPCDGRATPHLTLERIALVDGDAGAAPVAAGASLADLAGGGAVAMRGGRLTLTDAFVSGNACGDRDDAQGGAVLVVAAGAPAKISGSTFAANSCGSGGAIALRDTGASIVGSSLVDNVATGSGGGIVVAGTDQPLELALSTVAGNAAASGSGIDYAVPAGALTLRNSRVDDNTDAENAPSEGIRVAAPAAADAAPSTAAEDPPPVPGVTDDQG